MTDPQSRGSGLATMIKIAAFAIPIMLVIDLLTFTTLAKIWDALCPAGTFMSGYSGSELFLLIQILSGLTFSICAAWLIVKMRSKQGAKDRGSKVDLAIRHQRISNSPLVVGAVVSGTLLLLDFPCLALDFHCISGDGIFVRELPWLPARRYHWPDVRALGVECHHVEERRQEYWADNFTLTMRNGARIGLGGGHTDEVGIKRIDKLASILSKYPVVIDTSAIQAGCSPPDLRFFVQIKNSAEPRN
jgi:hypothetical protein